MLASYNWLRSMLPGLNASPAEAAERLTRAGLEVEELSEYGAASPHVVIAVVRRVERHPDRDKLSLVTVDRGGAEQTVVCGAPNVPAPGGKVVLAPLGVALPAAGMTVEPRSIAGAVSEGMLCSEGELGLVLGGPRGDGILVLPADHPAAAGTPLGRAVEGTHDWILDIGVTPNRPDALSHVGLARELATLFAIEPPRTEAAAPRRVASVRLHDLASVEIADTERCPHYGAAVVVDIEVRRSPAWLRYRLESLGVRAITNVVDVTNLVLLEYGQPLHAFDLDRLPGGRVVVRRAIEGEVMRTLDGVERELSSDDLLITDGERPIALAGVMGGADSEVTGATTRVLLECAYFTPRGVRRTSRRHGLHTEASHRFERGSDPECLPEVLAHTAALLTELGGGAAVPGTIMAGVAPSPRPRLRLRGQRLRDLLGLDVGVDRSAAILGRLGCEVSRQARQPDELEVVVPSFRPDLRLEEDLIEEVMRVHGIDELPATLRPMLPKVGRSTPTVELRARQAAEALGLSEALTFGFVAPAELEALGAEPACVRLQNPLTEDRTVMRTSLLVGLLQALCRARRHGVADARLFTVGRTFHASAEGPLPDERVGLAAVIAGEVAVGIDKPRPLDVYDAKGVAVEIVERVTLREAQVVSSSAPHLHPRATGEVMVAGVRVGRFGALHPDVVQRFDLVGPALAIEIDVTALEGLEPRYPRYRPVPTLPPVSRDLALLVREGVRAGELAETIGEAAGELCESVTLFDVFEGKGLPEGQRSLAYHLVFRDPLAATDPPSARTLTDKEVDALCAEVVTAVGIRFGAVVR